MLRGLDFAIVDEADSVLIDEARTPLIISETRRRTTHEDSACVEALDLVAELTEGADYRIDRSERRIDLTPAGQRRVERLSADARRAVGQHGGPLGTGGEGADRAAAVRARRALPGARRQVQIIDEYTGRIMPDRFWNDGLHQMIEAKEGCAASGQRELGRAHHLPALLHPLSPSLRHERHAGGSHARTAFGLSRRRRPHSRPITVPPAGRADSDRGRPRKRSGAPSPSMR